MAEQQDELVSFLDVRDLLALRLVSSETKSWVDTVMLGHRRKAFTLTLDEENRTLDGFMDEQKKMMNQNSIPFKTLNFEHTGASSFYSHPLLPSFLQTYGPQIHRIHTPSGFFLHPNIEPEFEVPPEKELAFYQGLSNLIHLSLFTSKVEENVPLPTIEEEKLPFLRNLQSFSIKFVGYEAYDSSEVIRNIDFLRHCPNLRKLSLPDMHMVGSVKVLTALGDYFAARNGYKEGYPPTLRIFIQNTTRQSLQGHQKQLLQIDEGMANKLLEELASSDGRILIENMPIMLLDGAVRLFSKQRGKLRNFGKCIISLNGFSSSFYEVELPNMRKLLVDGELIFLGKEREGDGDYTKTLRWPKLETIKLENTKLSFGDNISESDRDDDDDAHVPVPVKEDLSYMKKLVFESGLRATVKRLHYDFHLHFLSWDDEAPHLLRNLPNLTQLTLTFNEKDADSFRSLMRGLPTSSPKLQLLEISTRFPLKDEDFLLGMNGDGFCCVPPLLQLSGNYYQ
jgi:Leucine-rich repeat (LRR) protein